MNIRYAALARLPIRLSQRQLVTLIADLKPAFCASLTLKVRKDGALKPPWLQDSHELDDRHDCLLEFWRWISVIQGDLSQRRYRFNLNMLESGACILGLRAAARVQKSDPSSALGATRENNRLRRRLIRRLENHRRRARRILAAELGERAAALERDCAEYYKQLRRVLFPRPMKVRSACRHISKFALDRFTFLSVEGLKLAGVLDPPAKEVRKEVSACLRYSRRDASTSASAIWLEMKTWRGAISAL